MKKVIYNKFNKHDITDLPVASFQGRIVVITSAGETEKATIHLPETKSDPVHVTAEKPAKDDKKETPEKKPAPKAKAKAEKGGKKTADEAKPDAADKAGAVHGARPLLA